MLFDDQINKRRERETASLREVFGNTAKDMGFKVDRGSVKTLAITCFTCCWST